MDQPNDINDQSLSWQVLNLLPCTPELERADPVKATKLYEEALIINPGSYKVWHAYLQHRTRQVETKSINDPEYETVNNCYEKALIFMHRMPRIWIEYCTFLVKQLYVTRTRRAFDKALESLPITQHSRIWPLYVEFIKSNHVPVETAVRVFRRYMQYKPEDAELFIDYLYSKNRIDEAARRLCDVINNQHFNSIKDKTKHELWEELCDILSEFAEQIESINVEAVLRDGIRRFPDQEGRLWNSLARYYVNLGMFGSARNIFEEAINTVITKKAFVEIWEAYTNFEERYLERMLEQDDLTGRQMLELEIRQAALEELISNNALLLSRVALRQNPHNVNEWRKRVQLCDQLEEPDLAKDETYREALRTVNPKQALGHYEDLWIEYALFHYKCSSIQRAEEVFEKALRAQFAKGDDYAKVWCSYIEMKFLSNPKNALKLAKRATASTKNLKVWSLYVDLEENLGTFNSTKAAYERIIDLKIATPQLILNYASFLESRQYYEDSFRAYERGIALFSWPSCYNIWITYINKFISRYGSKKLDRIRDLLEKCLIDCPSKFSFEFYVLYGKIEEEDGLLSRAQAVYKRGLENIDSGDIESMVKIYKNTFYNIITTHHGLIQEE